MSVKCKVKRLNKQTLILQDALETERLSNIRLRHYIKQLENIIKLAITNQIGSLRGGILIKGYEIDKMNDLKLNIDDRSEFDGYIINVYYKGSDT